MAIFKHVLVGTDFSEASDAALDLAMALAREMGAELTVVHTAEIPVYTRCPPWISSRRSSSSSGRRSRSG